MVEISGVNWNSKLQWKFQPKISSEKFRCKIIMKISGKIEIQNCSENFRWKIQIQNFSGNFMWKIQIQNCSENFKWKIELQNYIIFSLY